MKRSTARVSLMVVVLLFAAASFGQQHQTLNFKADVPFEFSVGKTTLPAGEYLVTEIANHIWRCATVVPKPPYSWLVRHRLPGPPNPVSV
jgi:hypothetical protein